MKNILIFLLLCTINITTYAQQSEIVGTWQLSKVEVKENIYENLEAIYSFEEDGIIKVARSAQSKLYEVGKWKLKKNKKILIMRSKLDKDFDGKATIIKISKYELVYQKGDVVLYFKNLINIDPETIGKDTSVTNDISKSVSINIQRLKFTESDFFDDEGEYIYYDDEEKLPWKDTDALLMSLVNVKELVYKYSKLDDKSGDFTDNILTSVVNSNPSEQSLSIDYIFDGYDRYNLPEDVELQPNNEYSNSLYPEEDNAFRVSGSEQIKTPAGTFDCTVVEFVTNFEARKKLWMINDKPGIYAKIILDKPGEFGMYSIFELLEIKMKK